MDCPLFEFKRKKTALRSMCGKLEGQSRLFRKPVSVQLDNKIEFSYSGGGKGAFLETDERHRRPKKKEAVSAKKADDLLL
jgi:hypothetical protein